MKDDGEGDAVEKNVEKETNVGSTDDVGADMERMVSKFAKKKRKASEEKSADDEEDVLGLKDKKKKRKKDKKRED